MSSVAITPSELTSLQPGASLITNGNRLVTIPDSIVSSFQQGDKVFAIERPRNSRQPELVVDVIHIPYADLKKVDVCISNSVTAFNALKLCSDDKVSAFFESFAKLLSKDDVWATVAEANKADVAEATSKSRSTTRLKVSDSMRTNMIAGLNTWAAAPSPRHQVVESVTHDNPHWRCDVVQRELGPVAFVFEGRPNVLADAAGVIRAGNTVVLRIGSDAMRTAAALVEHCITPALAESALPPGTMELLPEPTHATSWALFADNRLRLAVARGSGRTVDLLGSIAQMSGVPVSLHGTGGAWGIATESAPSILPQVETFIVASLDRKVCNTLNTIAVVRSVAEAVFPTVLKALEAAGNKLKTSTKLHVHSSAKPYVPAELFSKQVDIIRASGTHSEVQAVEESDWTTLGKEWEWEGSPEVTLAVVDNALEDAVPLFNQHSPQFVASVWCTDEAQRDALYVALNAPFVGDALTRWVDGQKALRKPELGLSSWEQGRLLGRAGILTGDVITSRVLKHVSL